MQPLRGKGQKLDCESWELDDSPKFSYIGLAANGRTTPKILREHEAAPMALAAYLDFQVSTQTFQLQLAILHLISVHDVVELSHENQKKAKAKGQRGERRHDPMDRAARCPT